jgi:hypothetical protein
VKAFVGALPLLLFELFAILKLISKTDQRRDYREKTSSQTDNLHYQIKMNHGNSRIGYCNVKQQARTSGQI